MKYYLGIDNGVSGGLSLLNGLGEMKAAWPMPLTKTRKGNEVDAVSLRDILFYCDPLPIVVLEEPGGSKSAKAATSMAGAFHAVRATIELMGLKLIRITPQQWQRPFLKCKAGDTKPVALQMARTLWPTFSFKRTEKCRVADMGMVDAALIAEWARRNNL